MFVGFEVISKVSSMLHTPLMSGANAIHGVILVGAIIVTGQRRRRRRDSSLGLLAVLLATLNLVGGFVVTDRMLEMFRAGEGRRRSNEDETAEPPRERQRGSTSPTSSRRSASSSR